MDENALRNQIHIKHYSEEASSSEAAKLAGSPINSATFSTPSGRAYSQYKATLNNVTGTTSAINPYTPFANKTEWEFTRFTKLRGPSSIAVQELLSIENVHLSLRFTHLLSP